tara:strand:+ start:274 stop:642 length:369 start_codon:yes stop_codon:yes gene_type:complete
MAFNAFGALAFQSASSVGIGAAQESANCDRMNKELNDIIKNFQSNVTMLASDNVTGANSVPIKNYLQTAKEDVKKLTDSYQKARKQEVLDLEKTQIFMSLFLAVTIFILGIKIFYSQKYKKQ